MSTIARNLPQWVDPVCGMPVDEASAAARLTHAGKDYLFCSALRTVWLSSRAIRTGMPVPRLRRLRSRPRLRRPTACRCRRFCAKGSRVWPRTPSAVC